MEGDHTATHNVSALAPSRLRKQTHQVHKLLVTKHGLPISKRSSPTSGRAHLVRASQHCSRQLVQLYQSFHGVLALSDLYSNDQVRPDLRVWEQAGTDNGRIKIRLAVGHDDDFCWCKVGWREIMGVQGVDHSGVGCAFVS